MRDDLTFAERLHRDLREVRWPEAAELRARAARRSRRRRAVLAAATVFVVLSTSAVAAAALPHRPGMSPGAASGEIPRSRADIPIDALLQPADLAAKTQPPDIRAGLDESIVIDPELTSCVEAHGVSPFWERSRYSRSQGIKRDQPAPTPDPNGVAAEDPYLLIQDVHRLRPEQVGTFFAGVVDRRVVPCRNWSYVQNGEIDGEWLPVFERHRWEVVAEGFAGDEAVLIRHTVSEPRLKDARGEVLGRAPEQPYRTAVVRVGDLVTVFSLSRSASEEDLRRLAVVAAARLCAAANPRC